jgi:hypothetical protein
MNAKRIFEDDDLLFGDTDRASHVELKIDRGEDPASTQPELLAAEDYFLRVPHLALGERELTGLALDHREGFVLSRVDGHSTIETVLDVCAMPADEALEIISRLVERGIIALR